VLSLIPISKKRAVNEKGVVVETSTHSVNINHKGSSRGDITIILRYINGRLLLVGPYRAKFLSDMRKHAQSDKRLHRRKDLN
jgi:hypothetical protein